MNKKRMFSWMNQKLEVRETKKYGKGVFAKKNIKKGEILCIFGGYVLPIEEERADSGIQINDNLVLTSFDHKEPTDYINHSCYPNSGIKGQNFLVSMKKIEKDKEISFDYAMCLFSRTKEADYVFSCVCGDKKCRKIITSNDWKICELQKKYSGYFEWFIQNKIDKIKTL